MGKLAYRVTLIVLPLFVATIFIDSLFYKFTDAPETQIIFGRLDDWAATWGAAGLFGHTGVFSQYVIGIAELFASTWLLTGFIPVLGRFQVVGAGVGLAVMTGAIGFHLFTPLGIDPNQDGGGLFMAACAVWLSCAILLVLKRHDVVAIVRGVIRLLIHTPAR